ncbi:zinc ABC transporter substrate-binding protein ZnuA [Endozoicomonas arenosclerae]|uniref:zinc ABC transporter substrate-binding protein ZnuA n=1 Tax=Endozoicomonas arenosclerae TaxID=1633495 RepID=UPI0009A1E684|nr:zinc ABC transporter substrate-binding protein ZnuA [Endozoicomonas arenosclerae]
MTLSIKPKIMIWLAGLLISLALPAWSKEPPKVLTSIKPLQLIAASITEGVTSADVLLPPGASPHSHSMKPSDARKLYEADIIFWVGPDMETFLEKTLSGSKKAVSVPLMQESKLKLLKSSEGKEEVHDHHEGENEHHHGEYDAHIWLSPNNAIAMAKTMSEKLSKLDPEHKKQYKENYKSFKKSVQAADKLNNTKLTKFHDQPMFVFHDAYGYLQKHYKLNVVDYFTINPEQQPGAKHLTRLQEKLKKAGNSCVFREPQFQPAYIDRITGGTDASVAVLDPLATDIAVSPDGYNQFINGLVENIITCLKN